jgi:DMSO reductase family type II enzyme chaperone
MEKPVTGRRGGPGREFHELRSMAYRTFATAFEFPDQDALAVIRQGLLADALRRLLTALGPHQVKGAHWSALRDAGDGDALQEEFTRLFEAGETGPACPIRGGIYGSAGALEERVRYYRFFGLSLTQATQGEPDHLATELEFLLYLSFQQAQWKGEEVGLRGLMRAERDFIVRHTGAWVPLMRRKLMAQNTMPFFLELTRLLERFLEAEVRRLSDGVAAASNDSLSPLSPPASKGALKNVARAREGTRHG